VHSEGVVRRVTTLWAMVWNHTAEWSEVGTELRLAASSRGICDANERALLVALRLLGHSRKPGIRT